MTTYTGSGPPYPLLHLHPDGSGGGAAAAPDGPNWRYSSDGDLHKLLEQLGWPLHPFESTASGAARAGGRAGGCPPGSRGPARLPEREGAQAAALLHSRATTTGSDDRTAARCPSARAAATRSRRPTDTARAAAHRGLTRQPRLPPRRSLPLPHLWRDRPYQHPPPRPHRCHLRRLRRRLQQPGAERPLTAAERSRRMARRCPEARSVRPGTRLRPMAGRLHRGAFPRQGRVT